MQLPKPVLAALARLNEHGYDGYVVGGCVRDFLRGEQPQDYDITTDALPEEIAACFADYRLIETGLKHGTETVLIDCMPLEITTYRVDGEYTDHRRPDRVTFTRSLAEDLARRDFTVNAMAFHPQKGLVDLFDGQRHLREKRLVAVGDPDTRFTEDGLRILRALRFAATLGFSIEEQTERALYRQQRWLADLSVERIYSEFCKLLCGNHAERVLDTYREIIATCIPELQPAIGFQSSEGELYHHLIRTATAAPADLTLRLALLFHDIGKIESVDDHALIGSCLAEEALTRLKSDGETRHRVTWLVRHHADACPTTEVEVHRLLTTCSYTQARMLAQVMRVDRRPPKAVDAMEQWIDHLEQTDACVSLRQLAVNGRDLMALGMPAGPQIGKMLAQLLGMVAERQIPNEKASLLTAVKRQIKVEKV